MSVTLNIFLGAYPQEIRTRFLRAKEMLERELPNSEQHLDLSAKMLAFTYGSKYSEMICVLLPSQKGVKLAFPKGTELPDPEKLLGGTGKTTRYAELKSENDVELPELLELIRSAYRHYRNADLRTNK
jgi:hypothetical protein